MSSLEFLYNKLCSGESFGRIESHRLGGTYFWDVLWIGYGSGGKFIFWKHYGSSAARVTLENLNWILTTIFKTTPEQFLFDYTTYNEYKRIKACYGET